MERTRAALKTFFETGDIPTQEQFSDLLDSVYTKLNDEALVGLTTYSPIAVYTAGKTTIVAGVIYQANTTTTGTFNSAHWDAIGDGSDFDPENITTDLVFTKSTYQVLRKLATYSGIAFEQLIYLYTTGIDLYSGKVDASKYSRIRLNEFATGGVLDGIELEHVDSGVSNRINIRADKTSISKKIQLTAEPSSLDNDLDLVYKSWVLAQLTASAETYATIIATLGFTPEDAANKNANNGYAPLDSAGKVPLANLPSTLLKYIGQWNASTNTPTLTNPDTSRNGEVYDVSVAGTRFGLTFEVGDWLIYNDSGAPEKSVNSDNVINVNGQTGAVTLNTSHIAESGSTNLYFTPARQTANTNYIDAQNKKFEFSLSFSGATEIQENYPDASSISSVVVGAGLSSVSYIINNGTPVNTVSASYPVSIPLGATVVWRCVYSSGTMLQGSAFVKGQKI